MKHVGIMSATFALLKEDELRYVSFFLLALSMNPAAPQPDAYMHR